MSNAQKDNTEVLSYKIDTAEFDRGMDKVIAALEKLEKREYLTKLQSSMDGIALGMDSMDFGQMEQGLSSIEERFSTMGIVGMSVINNLTGAVMGFAESFIFDKLLANASNGFAELNIQIGATQTILSNTSTRFGTTLAEVNMGLESLNTYADKTIYNFSNMTQAVGAFTSAGVDLGNSIQAIKGIANMAAYAGAGAEAATSGMYQFSNALSMGYLQLYQWNSLVYSGLGTQTLVDELKSSAKGLGMDIDAIIKEYGGSFRYSLEAGWADSKVIMHTLAKMSGDVREEELRKMKYTEEEIKRILALGKAAQDSATKIISYEKLISSLNETIGSGWARTFRLIVGDFEQGKALFTMISDNLLKVIERGAENRNRIVEGWSTYGGRDVLVDGIDKVLKTYSRLLLVLGTSVNQIFPPITGRQVAEATKLLGKLVDMLIPTTKGFDNIGKIIRGFAASVDIPVQFFKALGRYLYLIIKPLLNFKMGWVDSVVGFAEFMTKLRDEIVKGDVFFKKITQWGEIFKIFLEKIRLFLEDVKKLPFVKKMREIFDAITLRFGIKDPKFLQKFLADAQASFASFFNSFDKAKALDTINKFIEAVIGFGKRVYRFLEPVILYVIELVTNFGKALGAAMADLGNNFTWDKLKDVMGILTKFLTLKTITTIIERFGFASEIFLTLGMGFAKTVGYISVALKQLVNANDTDTLLAVAVAIGILSASVFMLATLKEDDLQRGISAITAIYAGLAGSLMALNAVLAGSDTLMSLAGGTLKLMLLPPVLIAMALAMAIMADTMLKFKDVPFKQIMKGFVALIGMLGALTVFMQINSKNGVMSLSSGLGFLALAVSLSILAKSLKLFSEIQYEDLGKALVSVGSMMLIVALMSKAKVIGPKLMILAATISGIAGSLVVLGLAFKYLGSLDFVTIATGLTNLLVMLGAVYVAAVVGRRIKLTDIAMMALVAASVAGLGLAFGVLVKINPLPILTVSGAIAISILALYGAVSLISPSIVQSVAGLALLSVGIGAFALALSVFKTVDFGAVALGGLALAVFTIALVGLGTLITPLLPVVAAFAGILILGAGAMALFGAGVFLIAAGAKVLAEAMTLMSKAGNLFFESLIESMPKAGEAMIQFFVTLVAVATKVAPMIATIGTIIIIALCQALIDAIPYVSAAIIVVGSAIIDVFSTLGPKFDNMMFALLLNTLTNLEKHIGTYASLTNRILTKFIVGLAETNAPLVAAMSYYMITLLSALSDTIEKDGKAIRVELNRLALTIFKFFVEGMVESAHALNVGIEWWMDYMTYGAGKEITDNIEGIMGIGINFIAGIVSGMTGQAALGLLVGATGWVAQVLTGNMEVALDEHSPSKKGEKIGDFYIQGLGNGLNPEKIKSKMDIIKDALLNFMNGTVGNDMNFQPTITPVLDPGAMASIEKTIANAFSGQQFDFATAPGSSMNSAPVGPQTQGPKGEYTAFNQYISAPSPLSVEEIARRTSSLMAQSRRR